MKKVYFALVLAFTIIITQAQTVSKTLVHGGVTRNYIEHVPTIYNASTAVPLIICLHGLGDNMSNFTGIGMNQLANSQNFIVLTPQALDSPLGTAWNSGASYMGYQINGTVDDLGFIEKLIDTTMAMYNIDPQRVYATGFSLGSFMCHRLACQLNDRIAAIATVAGTIGSGLNCTPGRAVPVCHFHGTGDETIFYTGNSYGMDAMEVVNFWVDNNNCDTTPVITDVPDVVQDGFVIKHFVYDNGDDNSMVEHFRVDSAGHQWIYPPNNDMSYTQAIWDFLSRFTLPAWISVKENKPQPEFLIYPNPAQDMLYVRLENEKDIQLTLSDLSGRVLVDVLQTQSLQGINVSAFASGIYILNIRQGNTIIKSEKIIKN